jgi:sec-independent protein translocase protein TatA
MPFKLGPWELGLILLVVILVFGVGKLPDVGRQLGKGIRDFKKFSSGTDEEATKTSADKSEVNKVEPEIKKAEVDGTKSKLEVAEARVKALEESTKKTV